LSRDNYVSRSVIKLKVLSLRKPDHEGTALPALILFNHTDTIHFL